MAEVAAKLTFYHGAIYRYLEERGISRKQFADEVGIGVGTVHQLIVMKYKPSHEMAQKIADHIGCSIEDVLMPVIPKGTPRHVVKYGRLNVKAIAHHAAMSRKRALAWGRAPGATSKDAGALVEELMDTLNERQRLLVRMHYFDRKKYTEIAKEVGLTKERVRQIVEGALRTMSSRARFRVTEMGEDIFNEIMSKLDEGSEIDLGEDT